MRASFVLAVVLVAALAGPASAQFGFSRSNQVLSSSGQFWTEAIYDPTLDVFYAMSDECSVMRLPASTYSANYASTRIRFEGCVPSIALVGSMLFAVDGDGAMLYSTTLGALDNPQTFSNFSAVAVTAFDSSLATALSWNEAASQYELVRLTSTPLDISERIPVTGLPGFLTFSSAEFFVRVGDNYFYAYSGAVYRIPVAGGAVTQVSFGEIDRAIFTGDAIYVSSSNTITRLSIPLLTQTATNTVLDTTEIRVDAMTLRASTLYVSIQTNTGGKRYSRVTVSGDGSTLTRDNSGDQAGVTRNTFFAATRTNSSPVTLAFMSAGGFSENMFIEEYFANQECPTANCGGQGTCVDGICECDPDFWGDNCQNIMCEGGVECFGRGACLSDGTCSCNSEYWGDQCEKISCPGGNEFQCFGQGTCSDLGVCTCDEGYFSEGCEKVCGLDTDLVWIEVDGSIGLPLPGDDDDDDYYGDDDDDYYYFPSFIFEDPRSGNKQQRRQGPNEELVEVPVGDPSNPGQVVEACNSKGSCPARYIHSCGTCNVDCDCDEGWHGRWCTCEAERVDLNEEMTVTVQSQTSKRMFLSLEEFPSGFMIRATANQISNLGLYAGTSEQCPEFNNGFSYSEVNTTIGNGWTIEREVCSSTATDWMVLLHNFEDESVRTTVEFMSNTPPLRSGEKVRGSIDAPGEWEYYGFYLPVASTVAVTVDEIVMSTEQLGNLEIYIEASGCPTSLSYLDSDTTYSGATLRLDPTVGFPAGRYVLGVRVKDSAMSLPSYEYDMVVSFNTKDRDSSPAPAAAAPKLVFISLLLAILLGLLL